MRRRWRRWSKTFPPSRMGIKFIIPTDTASRPRLPGDLLKATSRSFYLTLRVLPAAVRSQIGLAYLLARTTDTIADTEILPVSQRLAALRLLAERIAGTASAPLNFTELARSQGLPAERILLEKVADTLRLLAEAGRIVGAGA